LKFNINLIINESDFLVKKLLDQLVYSCLKNYDKNNWNSVKYIFMNYPLTSYKKIENLLKLTKFLD
jgi:hypothetical protein